jgi:hypothetical protein
VLGTGVAMELSGGGLGRASVGGSLARLPLVGNVGDALNVSVGDCACELNSPNVEPTGEPRMTIEPTAARRTA